MYGLGGPAPGGKDTILKLCDGLCVLQHGINTGVLASGGRALLFNCCGMVAPALLASLGIERVDKILCTQYRRTTAAGLYAFAGSGAEIVVPKKEEYLFTRADEYWADPKNRWHIYHFMPDGDVLPLSIPAARAVAEGDIVRWGDFEIAVLDTPGATLGGVSYIVRARGENYCFCGDLIHGDGQLLDVHSMARGKGELTGYHGFMASRNELLASVRRVAGLCGTMIPPHGKAISEPRKAASLLERRIEQIYANYASISSMNYYFPGMITEGMEAPALMAPSPASPMPGFVRLVDFTSFAVISDDGAAFLIDCGAEQVVALLEQWLADGAISSLEGCWITHFHDDHVDAIGLLAERLGAKVFCCRELADILEHPDRWLLPCISPASAPATVLEDGQAFDWHEFRFTAMHYPGQTLYHGGLLVEGHGTKVLFAGDSGSPSGLDDYCPQNRCFLGQGRGARRTLELMREHRPDHVVNEHQRETFRFSDEQLDFMERALEERERMYATLFPWPSPDYGLDASWLRAYPYEQAASAGQTVLIELQATNHSERSLELSVRPMLPEGWALGAAEPGATSLPPRTCGLAGERYGNSDARLPFKLAIPADARNGRYVVPFGATLDGMYLGWLKHAIVNI